MGIRESMNRKPRVAAAVAVVLLLLACAVLAVQFAGADAGVTSKKAFFTIDDGKTWFVDDASKIAPFQHDGKQALRAYVFECNGQRFVNHVERFTPEGRQAAEAAIKANSAGHPAEAAAQVRLSGAEVKKPGAKLWAPLSDLPKAGPILRPKCPTGDGEPKPVEP